MSRSELCFQTAVELARLIRAREVSCEELMGAHIAQIERVNPKVNAIVTFLPEQALAAARVADAKLARGDAPPLETAPLYGLPVAHKDLVITKGIRTTFGSPIFRDFVPEADALIVERPGFPIRTSADQSLFAGSPQLFASYYVLRRL